MSSGSRPRATIPLSASLSQQTLWHITTTSRLTVDSGVSGWEPDRLITPKDMSKYLKGSWQAGMMNTVAPFYMAPEVADTGEGTCAGDIFSLGIVCAEIWLQKLPGSDQGETRLETKLYEPPMSLTMMRHRVVVCNSFTTHAPQAQAHTVPTSVLAKQKTEAALTWSAARTAESGPAHARQRPHKEAFA